MTAVGNVPSRNGVCDAVLDVLNTRLQLMQTPRVAYAFDDAPDDQDAYVAVLARRDEGGQYRVSGVGSTLWRLTVRAVGSVNDVSELLDICNGQLEDEVITVGHLESGGLRWAGASDITEDEDHQALFFGDVDYLLVF